MDYINFAGTSMEIFFIVVNFVRFICLMLKNIDSSGEFVIENNDIIFSCKILNLFANYQVSYIFFTLKCT